MAEIITKVITQPIVLRGADIDLYKIAKYILTKDHYHVFYKIEFQEKFKLKEGKLRLILKELERREIIVKYKSYPVFWKLK